MKKLTNKIKTYIAEQKYARARKIVDEYESQNHIEDGNTPTENIQTPEQQTPIIEETTSTQEVAEQPTLTEEERLNKQYPAHYLTYASYLKSEEIEGVGTITYNHRETFLLNNNLRGLSTSAIQLTGDNATSAKLKIVTDSNLDIYIIAQDGTKYQILTASLPTFRKEFATQVEINKNINFVNNLSRKTAIENLKTQNIIDKEFDN